MSDFVQQQHSICEFTSSDSWVILSPIEQSIKRKIESIGIPLKDWDIQINYGIKTGFNDAFIINTEKKNEILSKCQSSEERKRTEEIIRPILRGRDIKRYGYDWANLYIIATFPSKHYDIESFPAVKQYLLSFAYDYLIENKNEWVANNYLNEFCKQKLSQTGQYISINGKYVYDLKGNKEKSRKKTSNKWFETQDSISYWEDFSLPKIIWKRIGSILRFSYDNRGCLGLDSTCFATGSHIPYLCCILNSLMGHYLLKDSPKTGTGDLLVSVQAIEPAKVPFIAECEEVLENLLNQQINNYSEKTENEINRTVFAMYGLLPEEIEYITEYIKQSLQSQQ